MKEYGSSYPLYVCVILDDKVKIATPIVALVSEYSSLTDELLGSQLHYTDDKKRCFSTSGLWSSQPGYTRIELAGDGNDS